MKSLAVVAFALCTFAATQAHGENATGKRVYERHCVHCHAPGNEAVGTLQLARTRGAERAVLTEREDLDARYVRSVVRRGLNAMPAFVPSQLTDADLEALSQYLTK